MNLKNDYLLISVFILTIEVCIALFVRDAFIRPYFGDYLATILVYTTLRAFLSISVRKALFFSIVISYAVEFFQSVNGLKTLGWNTNELLNTVAGSTFDWGDMIAYTVGVMTVYLFEFKINHLKN